ALKQYDASYNPANKISDDLFVKLYSSIPIKESTLGRRNQLDRIMGQAPAVAETSSPFIQSQQPQVQQAAAPQAAPAAAAQQSAQEAPAAVKQQQAAPAPKAAAVSSAKRKTSIGKILTDEEW
ncbi:MAG: hypothetical protein KKD92_12765, partial [Proteobacteria bacterium]|nr:hypothetical protein [Pseudomonadota bacterium]